MRFTELTKGQQDALTTAASVDDWRGAMWRLGRSTDAVGWVLSSRAVRPLIEAGLFKFGHDSKHVSLTITGYRLVVPNDGQTWHSEGPITPDFIGDVVDYTPPPAEPVEAESSDTEPAAEAVKDAVDWAEDWEIKSEWTNGYCQAHSSISSWFRSFLTVDDAKKAIEAEHGVPTDVWQLIPNDDHGIYGYVYRPVSTVRPVEPAGPSEQVDMDPSDWQLVRHQDASVWAGLGGAPEGPWQSLDAAMEACVELAPEIEDWSRSVVGDNGEVEVWTPVLASWELHTDDPEQFDIGDWVIVYDDADGIRSEGGGPSLGPEAALKSLVDAFEAASSDIAVWTEFIDDKDGGFVVRYTPCTIDAVVSPADAYGWRFELESDKDDLVHGLNLVDGEWTKAGVVWSSVMKMQDWWLYNYPEANVEWLFDDAFITPASIDVAAPDVSERSDQTEFYDGHPVGSYEVTLSGGGGHRLAARPGDTVTLLVTGKAADVIYQMFDSGDMWGKKNKVKVTDVQRLPADLELLVKRVLAPPPDQPTLFGDAEREGALRRLGEIAEQLNRDELVVRDDKGRREFTDSTEPELEPEAESDAEAESEAEDDDEAEQSDDDGLAASIGALEAAEATVEVTADV